MQTARSKSGWHWSWGVAAAVAAASIVVILFLPTGDVAPPVPPPVSAPAPVPAPTPSPAVESIASLARLEPLPVQLTRGPVTPDSFEESRLLGIEAYEAGAYDSAAFHLKRALERRPDDEVRLYLGSAHLLGGDPGAAAGLLEVVAGRATDPTRLAEALWQLANAYVLLEQREGALETAQWLSALGARHRADADSLVSRLAGAGSSR